MFTDFDATTIPALEWTGAYWSVFTHEDATTGKAFTTRSEAIGECLRLRLLSAWTYFRDVQANLDDPSNTPDDVTHLQAELSHYGETIDELEAYLHPITVKRVRAHWSL